MPKTCSYHIIINGHLSPKTSIQVTNGNTLELTHENHKVPRIIAITMLFALAILSVYWSVVYHGILFILTLAIIPAILLVRFKKLEIRNHEILFREWSVLPFLNEEKTILLTSIKKVETDQGYFDKQFFVIDALFTTSYRGNTRPASIAFHLDTGETYTIVKFGDKSRFQEISKRIKTGANHT